MSARNLLQTAARLFAVAQVASAVAQIAFAAAQAAFAVAPVVWLLAVSPLAHAGAAGPSPPGIESCAQVADDKQRLACFDRAVAAARKDRVQSGTPATAATAPTPSSISHLSPEQRMGLPPGKIEKLESSSRAPDLTELTVKIRAVSTDSRGRRVFTLENGQVWQQIEPDARFAVQPGDTVRIGKGALGSFSMSASAHMNTRVTRFR